MGSWQPTSRASGRGGYITKTLLGAASIAVLTLGAAAAAAAEAAKAVEEVVVTGSRVARSGFETPTPLTSITPEEMKLRAPTAMIQMLAEIPALRPNGRTNRADNVGFSGLDLRSLGPNRTLVLIDGRRLAPTSPSLGIDINILPAALINRVEIVTGGASAAYGSDAVSGVVNVFLDSKFTGFKAEAQVGQTSYSDNKEFSAAVTWGHEFADGKGHIVASANTFQTEGIPSQLARPWGRESWGILANPAFTATNGQVRQFLVPNVYNSRFTDGGVITAPATGPLANIQFGANGAQSIFNVGTARGATFQIGGDGAHFSDYAVLLPNVRRVNAFGRATWDFSDTLQGFVESIYYKSQQRYAISPNYNAGDITIRRENAFLPANIRTIMTTNNIATFSFGRTNQETKFNEYLGENEGLRTSTGLSGRFGDSWSWDASIQYTENHYLTTTYNNRDQVKWAFSIDSIIDPVSGKAICRPLGAAPAATATQAVKDAYALQQQQITGCVPVNLFGLNTITPDVVAYVLGTSIVDSRQSQGDISINLRGEPFNTWAGPVSVAAGLEYRKDRISQDADEISIRQGWRASNSTPFSGKVDVKEGYFEAVIPLLKDQPLGKNMDFDGAVRVTEYSTSGRVTTWKAGLNYTPIEDLRFRVTRSRDIRAPSIAELYTTGTLRTGIPIVDRTNNTSLSVLGSTGGNPALTPELADTLTYGAVYQPSWLPGFKISVDAFDISIKDAIAASGTQDVIDRCFRGETGFCASIFRNAAGVITRVDNNSYNASKTATDGYDIEVSYRFPLSTIVDAWGGDLTLRSLATRTEHITQINKNAATGGDVITDTAGQIGGGGAPKWRVATTASYSNGPLELRVLGNYIGGGTISNSNTPLDLANNDVDARFYTSFSGSYKFNEHLQVFGRIDNAFDVAPPPVPVTLVVNATAGSDWYDRVGRTFSLGVRYQH